MSNTTEHIKFGVVMQVKDEADVLDACLERWLALGASRIQICNDNSTDGTEKILNKHSFSGLCDDRGRVSVICYPKEPYQMQRHIADAKWLCICNDINWIIPADADEIWHFPNNDPVAFFASLPQVPSWGEVPYYDNFPNGVRRLHTHKKCFGYLTEEMEISIGNHMILDGDKWPKIENHGVYIEHNPVRSYEQMKRKLINHMEAYVSQHPEHAHAQNWHKWQEMGESFFEMKWKEFNPPA